jgi:hypothetical protein
MSGGAEGGKGRPPVRWSPFSLSFAHGGKLFAKATAAR